MTSFAKTMAGIGLCLLVGACAESAGPDRLKPVAAAPAAPSCSGFSFPIYFGKGSDQLTTPARAVLLSGAGRARGCPVAKIEVLGLADADGPRTRNLALSRRRAATVVKALEGFGLPAPVFDIEAIGEAGAKGPKGAPEPLRRRTEVVIHVNSAAAKAG